MFAASCGAFSGAVGNILGGIFMQRKKMKPVGSAKMYVAALVIGLCGTTTLMLLACPQQVIAGDKLSTTMTYVFDL